MRLRIGLALLLPVLMLAVLGPLLLIDPEQSDILNRKMPPFSDWARPLGLDLLGRDNFARLAYGLRLTLITGVLALLVALPLGGGIGLAILAKQPQFAAVIVKTISQIIVLLWTITMSIFLFATIMKKTDSLEWTLGLIAHAVIFGAAILLLILRKKASLLPETPERSRWTGMGWRIVRLLLAIPILTPCIMIAIQLLEATRGFLPVTLISGITIGLVIAPFTLRTTLATAKAARVPQAIGLGLFSALAWALLACSFLGFIGIGQPSFNADLGRLMMSDLPDPVIPLAALLTLIITVAGLVLTGDGIRQTLTTPKASAPH